MKLDMYIRLPNFYFLFYLNGHKLAFTTAMKMEWCCIFESIRKWNKRYIRPKLCRTQNRKGIPRTKPYSLARYPGWSLYRHAVVGSRTHHHFIIILFNGRWISVWKLHLLLQSGFKQLSNHTNKVCNLQFCRELSGHGAFRSGPLWSYRLRIHYHSELIIVSLIIPANWMRTVMRRVWFSMHSRRKRSFCAPFGSRCFYMSHSTFT